MRPNQPAVLLHYLAANRKSEPAAVAYIAAGFVGSVKRVEYSAEAFVINAHAVIGNFKNNAVLVFRNTERDFALNTLALVFYAV